MARVSKPSCDQEGNLRRLMDTSPGIRELLHCLCLDFLLSKKTKTSVSTVTKNYSEAFLLLVAKHLPNQ